MQRRQTSRGFTLVELLAVVAIIGVLAVLAVAGFRKYMNSARTGDAKSIIAAIRVAEESYRAETLSYLSCSDTLTDYYPVAKPDGKKRHWVQTHAKRDVWMTLNVATDSPTAFVFAVNAGGPGAAPPAPSTASKPTWPNPTTEPWYVIQAAGDSDQDGNTYALLVSSSFNGEIYVENETE